MITVVTFFWNDPSRERSYKFTPRHVEIMRNMVSRHLTLPHRFVCVTDEKLDGIETVPIDWAKHIPGTCAVKLMMWRPDIGKVLGKRIFYLDLDVVLVDNIDSIAGRPEDVVLWRNPNFPQKGRAFYQGSVQLFSAGARPELWNDFNPKETVRNMFWADPSRPATPLNWRFGGMEQCWISERLSWNEAYWDHRDGIYGAGRLGDWKEGVQSVLPANARIVSFPGNREPSQPEVAQKHPFVKEHYR